MLFVLDPPVAAVSRAPARRRDVGTGAGEGYTVNLPVPGGTGDAAYRSLVEHVVGAADPRRGEPQLVLVSAGFDAHRDDPLATLPGDRGGLRGA